ncbi:hypothetical protein M5E87_02060 [Flavonifractor plautii]|nr:hypothetical protein M5E87_02060 [Flavonifractor plautii]
MNERDTHTLKANPYGSLGTLKWTSSKPEIVTVTGDGYLYAKAQGEDAVITVSDASGNYRAACSVTVKRNTADIIFGSAGVGSRWPSPPFAPNCKTSAAACWEALCAISAD